MYKIILIILYVSSITLNIFSQTTLTSSMNPAPGDIQYQVSADTNGIGPGGSGANQVWNYTNLIKVDSSQIQWMLPSDAPCNHPFPSAKIVALDTCCNYFDTTGNKMQYVGYYSHGSAMQFSNFETLLTYPFSYNSNFTDNFAAVMAMTNDTMIRNGTMNVTADAYGTINLPFGSYSNALRLKEITNESDSSTANHIAIQTNFTIYEWYVPGKKFCVFKIVYMTIIIPQFGTISRKNVFYNPSSAPIGITQIGQSVPKDFNLEQNYPNPFNPSTSIKFSVADFGPVKVEVLDVLGRSVATLVDQALKPGKYKVDFDAGNLPSGVYLCTMKTGNYSGTEKMILLK